MSVPFPEPSNELADAKDLLLRYLDFYRSVVAAKVAGLSDGELRMSRLPSGWTPLGMVKHLVFMERRWLVWGFLGEQVVEPWGDRGPEDSWYVDPAETVADLVAAMRRGGERTAEIVAAAELEAVGAVGGRFTGEKSPPTLAWILFHVLQEYARHAGHLDIARELADGSTGETT